MVGARELGVCFLCAWKLTVGEYLTANVRSGEGPWRQVQLCKPCGKKVAELDDAKVVKNGEWYTVRVSK